MNDKKVNRFLIPIAIIIVIFSIFKTIKNDKNEEQLKLENNFVIGEITDHKITGLAETYYIYFKYNVNGIEYSKSVNNSFKYSDCERTRNCIGIKHPVYYDIENPKNSFMDFNSTELEFNRLKIQKEKFGNRINELKTE